MHFFACIFCFSKVGQIFQKLLMCVCLYFIACILERLMDFAKSHVSLFVCFHLCLCVQFLKSLCLERDFS
jgi:hypothetical protein